SLSWEDSPGGRYQNVARRVWEDIAGRSLRHGGSGAVDLGGLRVMRARLRRIAAILLLLVYLLGGSAARVVPLFAWQAVDIVLWGFISRYLNSVSASRLNFVPSVLWAVVVCEFLVRVIHGFIVT